MNTASLGDEALPAETLIAEDGAAALEGAAAGAVEPAEETPEQTAAKATAARIALLEEKLTASREKRQAQRVIEKAKAERKAAADERKAAAAERSKYDGLKEGSFKDTLTALGRDPRKTFEEMQREAIEYSTPEAAAKREQARIDARLAEQQERLDRIERERTDAAARERALAHEANLAHHFTTALADPAFKDLRIEYSEDALLDHAKYYDKHPAELRVHAKTFGVRLTDAQGRFTMHELLQVLSAAQADHYAGKQKREAAQSPPEAQVGKPPTVNGTAERRNAGTVTNDLATQRASPGPKVSGSVKERLQRSIDEEIRRSKGG
jgi:hypothetical protein